jgi:hypothetical protein
LLVARPQSLAAVIAEDSGLEGLSEAQILESVRARVC